MFITAGRDLDTTPSSSSWSWILVAIVEQLIKLKFLVQQVELKWLILNKWRRLVPLITFEISFGQHVCELMFGVKTDLGLGVQMNLVKQPIEGSSVGPWNMPHCGTSTYDNHLDHCFVVKDIQHSAGVRMRCIWWNVINVCWNVVGVLDWDGVVHVWLDTCRRVSPWLSLQSISSVRYGMKYFNHQIPQRAWILSTRKLASREMISASVELCETEVCFLHIQLIGTNVWLPKMHRILLDVDFESSRSPAESESWNKRFCPFCYSTRKLVHKPQNVRSPNTS